MGTKIINIVIVILKSLIESPYFWIGICILVGTSIVKKAIKFYKKRRSDYLTTLIVEARRKIRKSPNIFKNWFSQIYVPSLHSFLIVFVPFLLLLFLSRCQKLNIPLIQEPPTNLIAIHAGIAVIIFALIIFIAQSLRDDEIKDKARVLLKVSFLYPLVVSTILSFFIYLFGNINLLGLLPLLFIGVFTIVSLSNLIHVLLYKSRFFQERVRLLKDRLKRSIHLAINERLGNQILLKNLGKDKKLH